MANADQGYSLPGPAGFILNNWKGILISIVFMILLLIGIKMWFCNTVIGGAICTVLDWIWWFITLLATPFTG